MLHALAALPRLDRKRTKLVSCVYDIPSPQDTGLLDRRIHAAAWRRLARADVVWSSDEFKAALVQRSAHLPMTPIVCHNCPSLQWLPQANSVRSGWLRERLRGQGAELGERGGCIILRAGAIGDLCGIHETLTALHSLPKDCVFLMMGRPHPTFRTPLLARLAEPELRRRAFFWDCPSDDDWTRAHLGADVGHLVHGPWLSGAARRANELNSSLSNNRLFNYMAASLPIVVHEDQRMDQLVKDTGCFRVVNNQDLSRSLVPVLRELYESPTERERLGLLARRAHESRYNWECQFQPVAEAIHRLGSADDSLDFPRAYGDNVL
jgi:hypothetical protein